jgi:hypothetical protein
MESPPSFYAADVSRYIQKFQNQIEQRRIRKKEIERVFKCSFDEGSSP